MKRFAGLRGYIWFRLHHTFPGDPKWRKVARRARLSLAEVEAVMLRIYRAASMHPVRGNVEDFDADEAAAELGLPERRVRRMVKVLIAMSVIDQDYVSQWDKFQPDRNDDTSALRAARYRSRKKQNPDSMKMGTSERSSRVTSVTVTHQTQSQNIDSSMPQELETGRIVTARELMSEKRRRSQPTLPLPPVAIKGGIRG